MNSAADYDQYLPELLTLTRRVAADLDRIAAVPAPELHRAEPEHRDRTDAGEPITRIIWRRNEFTWNEDDRAMIPATATWLRDELPRLAATVVATGGVNIDGDEEDRYTEFLPEDVQSVLGANFMLDADGQMSYWRPEDKERGVLGSHVYRQTTAADLLAAWTAFVRRDDNNYDLSALRNALETGNARLDRPNTDLVADLTQAPTTDQEKALAGLKNALFERGNAESKLSAAERAVADHVRACLGAAVPAIELAQRLHVTRARIYQIRDGRR